MVLHADHNICELKNRLHRLPSHLQCMIKFHNNFIRFKELLEIP